jgi:hypothetical protein
VPAALAYYIAAVLVILPRTFPIRLALLPVTLWAFFRAATSIDVVAALADPGYDFLAYFICVSRCFISLLADVKRSGYVDSWSQ